MSTTLKLTGSLAALLLVASALAAAGPLDPQQQKSTCKYTKDGGTCVHRATRTYGASTDGGPQPSDTGAGAWVIVANQSANGTSRKTTPNAWWENVTSVKVVADGEAGGHAVGASEEVQLIDYHGVQPGASTENASVKVFSPGVTLDGDGVLPSDLPHDPRSVTYTRRVQGDVHTCDVEADTLPAQRGLDCPSREDVAAEAGRILGEVLSTIPLTVAP